MYVLLTALDAPSAVMRAGVSQEGMADLVKSIRDNGLINPIVVRKKGKKYELIAGYRRVLAHEKLGMEKILARVVQADDLKAERLKIDENREREDVNALDEGMYFLAIMRTYKWNQKELAQVCRYSEAYVSQRVSSTEWPEILRDAIIDEKINFSVARELAGVKDPGELEALVIMAVKSGVTPAVAAQWRQDANRELEKFHMDGEPEMGAPEVGSSGRLTIACRTCGSEEPVGDAETLTVCASCGRKISFAVKQGVFTAKEEKEGATPE